MKTFKLKPKISRQLKLKENCWSCEFICPQIARTALAGQFIDIRVSDKCDPLLRRPISICAVNGSTVKIFYEVVGTATGILAQKKSGESLDIIGPLGNGFAYPARPGKKQVILVAGGMGVAPLVFLAQKLKNARVSVLLGAKTKEKLLCVQEFKKLGCKVKVSTEDGSSGFKGRVTQLLERQLDNSAAIYACGPKPMLKAVAGISADSGVPAQLSLEEHMSCGFGACLGCVVQTKDGWRRVCKEGPVFDARDLVW